MNDEDLRSLYLDLLATALTRSNERVAWREPWASNWKRHLLRPTQKLLSRYGYRLVHRGTVDPTAKIWPETAETMIGSAGMANLRTCVENVIADAIPGDLVETGVWRGGACIFMRGILAAHEVTDRSVWVCDSFEGLPAPDPRYPADAPDKLHLSRDVLGISLEEVQANFAGYALLDDQVRFVKGWFRDTLPGLEVEQVAVLRLDGDMYESTMDALDALYPKLAPGGYCIIDDYGALDSCAQAVHDYRDVHGITEPIEHVNDLIVFWRRAL